MTDYDKLLDAETRAFVERTNSWYPPETAGYSIERQREIYALMCREFFAGHPDGVSAETTAIAAPGRAIPVRLYRRTPEPEAVVLYFHGGGFVLGGLDSHDDVCAELCTRTGHAVASVAYRLAPEHRHPAAFDDALAAFEWAAGAGRTPILLCGDSAGGNLAAAVSHATRGHAERPAGQVLIYPALGGDASRGSYLRHAEAPLLSVRDLAFYEATRTDGRERPGDATLAPLADGDFSGLPPTVVFTAECDPLSSDGEVYRDRILAAGGKAFWREEKGLVHGYLRARYSVARAATSFTRIVEALAALGKGGWVR